MLGKGMYVICNTPIIQQQVEGAEVAGHGHCQAEEQCDREPEEQSEQEKRVVDALSRE